MLHVIDFDQLKIENQQALARPSRFTLCSGTQGRIGAQWKTMVLKTEFGSHLLPGPPTLISTRLFGEPYYAVQYNEKIEERNNEFSKLKLTTGNIGPLPARACQRDTYHAPACTTPACTAPVGTATCSHRTRIARARGRSAQCKS